MLYERNGGFWRLAFTFRRKRHFLSFGRVNRSEAEAQSAAALALLRRVRRGELALPEGMNISTFLCFGGIVPDDYLPPSAPRLHSDRPDLGPA